MLNQKLFELLCNILVLFCRFKIRWWLCKETLENVYEFDKELRVSFKLKLVPLLYKCPDGYHFDIKVRRCKQKEIATCRTPTALKSKYEDVGLLQLLFLTP